MKTRLVRSVVAVMVLLGCVVSPVFAGFLQFPLHGCSDPSCTVNYATHGAYSAGAIISVLDHSMVLNANNYYPYGPTATSINGGNGIIKAFNGEVVNGTRLGSDLVCVGGTIYLHPDWNPSVRMTNDGGCGVNYSSYDEHPGYDYKAVAGTPVYAAYSGYVLGTTCYMGNTSSGSCASWGAIGINHQNGYISQYFHMATTFVTAGSYVYAGQQIGTVGGKCGSGCNLIPHLHFEVRHIGPTIGAEAYPAVDPYGWVGGGSDSLYSAPYVTPANLWQ